MSKAKKLKENVRFECADILDIMGRIVEAHTEHYKNDFDIDKKILWSASTKPERQDRTYVWLCRKSGTWLLRERDIYICDTRENVTFRHYQEQKIGGVLAFIVEVTGYTAHTVIGNFYTAAYEEYYRNVMEKMLPVQSILLSYEGGSRTLEPGTALNGYIDDCKYGKCVSVEHQPDSPEKLKEILRDEQYRREHFDSGDVDRFIERLALI